MIVAVCVGNENGVAFNGRRLSRDRAQQADLLALCGEGRLWVDAFSAPLFADHAERLRVSADFLEQAGEKEICFVENRPLRPFLHRMEGLVLYRWNRAYPSDVRLDVDVEADFVLTQQRDFPGSSHRRITREIYKRRENHGENT
ncbi:ribonuclease Z [Oscillibacter sp.]|uniref:ribonuclease Z n=1 Tax=Oscillibacter sp. TaxID=1945593 RepID=UPI002616F015|nr:ribonuclease Z [Oscillibacter sp.]MDD3347738.1 ribonuclease Z [Oscillibacter sp.]